MESSAVVLEFPSEVVKIPPRRIRRRLMECKKSPSITSVQDIEAKLKQADLRRQQFHEWLSNKARPKPKTPPPPSSSSSSSSSSQDDQHIIGQRLQAKLHAAHQKRLSIIAKAQMRLARLDELRQAAKSDVEMRFESRREELGTKVESRVQKAEVNRMLLLKAHRQQKAAARERTAQSLLQRMIQERKYKDYVSAAIYRKRTAAERKRMGLLEAEKTRVHAKVMQVRLAARSVYHQREVERRRMKDRLEDRLQRAKNQRAEYLRKKGDLLRIKIHRQGDILSRKLARCWRQFLRSRKSTFELAKNYKALEINEKLVMSMQFEQLALRIESGGTLQTVKALLDRLENRLTLSRTTIASNTPSSLDNIDHLLKRLSSPKRRSTPSGTTRNRGPRKVRTSEGGQDSTKMSRYPVRVALCSYMILGHPDAVFNGQGESEKLLAESAANFIQEFELLIKIILDGPMQNTHLDSTPTLPNKRTFRTQLDCFDAAWCSYLYHFVVWKVKDARSLEDDLVRAACKMEVSMMQTCKIGADEGETNLTHDMKAVQKQVTEDQKLLREKVLHLSGDAGVKRLECALSNARSRYFEARKNGSPIISPIAHILSPDLPSSSAGSSSLCTSSERSILVEGGNKSSCVIRSLFNNNISSPPKKFDSSTPSNTRAQLNSSDESLPTDNELLVNEIIHVHPYTLANRLDVSNEDQNNIQAKTKETMENAFWDCVEESLRQNNPDYGRILDLVKEVRDELCEMAPQSWKQNILDAIDLDLLSQVLMSGTHDLSYLGEILVFALNTLQKLSAPASEDQMMETHKKLIDELGEISQVGGRTNTSFVISTIKGLRFVLEQIQILKREISKARIRILEPVIQGPAGFEYLRKAFGNRYGSPLNASNSLPLTVQWLSTVRSTVEQAWNEHTYSLSGLSTGHASSTLGLPAHTSLRTGGSISVASKGQPISGSPISVITTTGNHQPECRGDRVDKMVRFGLLKITSGIEGLTQETIPETLKLNLSRLRNVQAQLQKIIVTSTSILVLRQTLLCEDLVTCSADIESVTSNCFERLTEILDHVEDVGITEIMETIIKASGDHSGKLQSRKEVMESMLAKSLRAGDTVFARVFHAIFLAARGILFGGTGLQGKELAETALRRVGGAVLLEKLMKAVEDLIMVATVSCNVHGPWYEEMLKNL